MFHPEGPSFWELAEQALSSTDRGYDLIAPKFEYTPFRTPEHILEGVAQHIGPPGSLKTGIDVCTGTGAGLRMLRPICTEEALGIDRSQGMLDENRRLCDAETAEGLAPVTLVQGDALEMDYADRFDVAVCFGAFGHILPQDQEAFLAAIFRALKPGGRFVFATTPMPSPLSRYWIVARGFNAAMHVRNAVLNPPFIMYYLLFTLEHATDLLWKAGFEVEARSLPDAHPRLDVRCVIARKPS